MTSENFCYWLQGYFEIELADKNKGAEALSYQQTEEIRKHLALVMNRVTAMRNPPVISPITPQEVQTAIGVGFPGINPFPSNFPRPPEIYCATGQATKVECSVDGSAK